VESNQKSCTGGAFSEWFPLSKDGAEEEAGIDFTKLYLLLGKFSSSNCGQGKATYKKSIMNSM
jgi:hypothetical protein